jgi:hypothetical protein
MAKGNFGMVNLLCVLYLFSRPLPFDVAQGRSTDVEILPPRPAEAKISIASRYDQSFYLKGMKLLPGQVAQAKSLNCLRVPARHRERSGEAGGSAAKIFCPIKSCCKYLILI